MTTVNHERPTVQGLRFLLALLFVVGALGFVNASVSRTIANPFENTSSSSWPSSSDSHVYSRSLLTGEEEEETTEEEVPQSLVIMTIILVLIGLTIVFETMKEAMEERADHTMKPILEKLFGELTVLGFLSMFTFGITKTGYFSILSVRLYGNHEELLEVFEQIHFCIFFVMICFVLQVFVLVGEAMEQEEIWLAMDRQCQEMAAAEDSAARSSNSIGDLQRIRARWSFWSLVPGLRQTQQERDEDFCVFRALREEFILDRSLEPPFAPMQQQQQSSSSRSRGADSKGIGVDFNFGRYLSVCLGTTLSHTVEVSRATWTFFGFGSVLYAGLHWVLREHATLTLVAVWIGAGWAFVVLEVLLEQHLLDVRYQFVAIDSTTASQQTNTDGAAVTATDSTPLVGADHSNCAPRPALPGWTRVDLGEFRRKRPKWIEWLVGGTPNRQHALYWFDRKGPHYFLYMLQVKLIFVGIYVAIHCLEFLGPMWQTSSLYGFLAYVVSSVVPMLAIVFNSKHFMATLAQVCCLGTHQRPQVVAAVLREDKTAAAVRSFLCIYKLQKFASQAGDMHTRHTAEVEEGVSPAHASASFSQLEEFEVGRTFDSFDLTNSGSITLEEIQDLMLSLGAPIMPSTLRTIMRQLDLNDDGSISRTEFIQWYFKSMGDEDHLSEHERAVCLFSLFDQNQSGEISIGEFKLKLDSLNAGLTIDEIGAIVNELDENNSGTIGVKEFEILLHHYYPRELDHPRLSHT